MGIAWLLWSCNIRLSRPLVGGRVGPVGFRGILEAEQLLEASAKVR